MGITFISSTSGTIHTSTEEQETIMAEMAYTAASNTSVAETVAALQKASEEAGWTVLAASDLRQRFENKGIHWETGLTIVEICHSRYASGMVAIDPRLALHLPCPIVVRESDSGVEVSVLRPSYVSSLFPEADFGEAPASAEAEVIAIVNAAVS